MPDWTERLIHNDLTSTSIYECVCGVLLGCIANRLQNYETGSGGRIHNDMSPTHVCHISAELLLYNACSVVPFMAIIYYVIRDIFISNTITSAISFTQLTQTQIFLLQLKAVEPYTFHLKQVQTACMPKICKLGKVKVWQLLRV